MGIDLNLLPFSGPYERSSFSKTVLSCARFQELFDEVKKLKAREVPETFDSYMGNSLTCEEHHFGDTQVDPNGDQVMCVQVKQLLQFSQHELVRDIPINRAIWAYLAELPPNTWVALYWH